MKREKKSQCLVCGWKMRVVLRGLIDNRFGSPGRFFIEQCRHCGLLQTKPEIGKKKLKQLYETHYNSSKHSLKIYHKMRNTFFSSSAVRFWLAIDGDIFFSSIRGSGRLLDVGCNEGRGMRFFRMNGFSPEGLELNKIAAKRARMAGFNVHTEPIEEFQPEKPFDVVVLSNVIEHSLNPKEMLRNVRRILKPNGQVWISCPNSESWLRWLFGRSWINWHVPFHIYHFSNKTLNRLLINSGFEIKDRKFVTPCQWVSYSILAAIFAKPGQETRQLRNPLCVTLLMIFCLLFFPVLWLGNLTEHGDCLIVEAGLRSEN